MLCPVCQRYILQAIHNYHKQEHEEEPSVYLCALCGEEQLTTENTEIHGAELSVYLCALCGEKNIHHGEHRETRSRILCAPLCPLW